jgi:uncharacterized protein (DUF1499 family)
MPLQRLRHLQSIGRRLAACAKANQDLRKGKRDVPSAHLVLIPLLAAASMMGVVGIGVRIFMSQLSQDEITPQEGVDLATLRPPLPRPSFLACPPHYCAAHPGAIVPIFAAPWQRLRDDWTKMIARQPRTIEADVRLGGRQIIYIQHSFLFRFPDIVTVEFIPFGAARSSLAVYSRSRYGRGDFHQNQRRVDSWLSQLEKLTPPFAAVSRRLD